LRDPDSFAELQREPLGAGADLVSGLFSVGRSESPLTARRVTFGSPFHVLTEIPWVPIAGSGGVLWLFISQVERIWNMPKRIRVESKRLDAEEQRAEREYWEELAASVHAEDAYWLHRRATSGRYLQGPSLPPALRGADGKLSEGSTPPTRPKRGRRGRRR
jgi:hypothetical protein